MASPDGTREEALEVEIAEYLGEHGWVYSPNDDGYEVIADRLRVLGYSPLVS